MAKDISYKRFFAKLSIMYRQNTGSSLEYGAFFNVWNIHRPVLGRLMNKIIPMKMVKYEDCMKMSEKAVNKIERLLESMENY